MEKYVIVDDVDMDVALYLSEFSQKYNRCKTIKEKVQLLKSFKFPLIDDDNEILDDPIDEKSVKYYQTPQEERYFLH